MSPTCARVTTPSSTTAQVMVAPTARPCAASWTAARRRLHQAHRLRRRGSQARAADDPASTARTAAWLATSPASMPPIPSTTQRRARVIARS